MIHRYHPNETNFLLVCFRNETVSEALQIEKIFSGFFVSKSISCGNLCFAFDGF
ncbi:hypothetical protein P3G55_19335 [Leptospira sp. 96542]|nr:hypothetical protein [Leptospira sp. 96542]